GETDEFGSWISACPELYRGLQPGAPPDRNRLLPRLSARLPRPAAASATSSLTAGCHARSQPSARRSPHPSPLDSRLARPLDELPRQEARAASMSAQHPWP